jgi:hypothetical protein
VREISSIARQAFSFVDHNSASILTGLSVVGVVGTAVLAVRATPEAMIRIEDGLNEKQDEYYRSKGDMKDEGFFGGLTKFEVVKVAWKPYIPASLLGLGTIAAIIGSRTIDSKRNAALAAAYSLTERAYHEYKEKAVVTMGEKKEAEMRTELRAEQSDRELGLREENGHNLVMLNDDSKVLFFDTLSGRHFHNDVQSVRKAVNDINEQILHNDYASLTDFYQKIGVGKTDMSDNLGWNTSKLLEIHLGPFAMAEPLRPALAIEYQEMPKPDFWRPW